MVLVLKKVNLIELLKHYVNQVQPFKPFIYALALENNYSPASLVLDAPLVLEQGIDLKMWKPEKLWKKILWTINTENGIRKIKKFNDC